MGVKVGESLNYCKPSLLDFQRYSRLQDVSIVKNCVKKSTFLLYNVKSTASFKMYPMYKIMFKKSKCFIYLR